jgi:hypothetical protein
MNRRLWLIFLALMFSALFARGQSGQSLLSDEVFRKLAEESFVAHDVDKDGYLVGEEIPQDIRYMMILAKACPETRLNLQQFLEYREAAYRFRVAAEFKMRDRNDDGILQMHEMPLALMKHLGKYSSGGDRVNLQVPSCIAPVNFPRDYRNGSRGSIRTKMVRSHCLNGGKPASRLTSSNCGTAMTTA